MEDCPKMETQSDQIGPYRSLSSLRRELQRLHGPDGLSWRQIASLGVFGDVSHATLAAIAHGRDPADPETRKQLALDPIRERDGFMTALGDPPNQAEIDRASASVLSHAQKLPAIQAEILRFIIRAAPLSVSRKSLAHAVGLSDRMLRREIEKLRRNHWIGACVISSSSGAGYRWSEDPDELMQATAEDLSRIEAARAKIAMRDKALKIIRARPLEQGSFA
jgi:hypothetical protein